MLKGQGPGGGLGAILDVSPSQCMWVCECHQCRHMQSLGKELGAPLSLEGASEKLGMKCELHLLWLFLRMNQR